MTAPAHSLPPHGEGGKGRQAGAKSWPALEREGKEKNQISALLTFGSYHQGRKEKGLTDHGVGEKKKKKATPRAAPLRGPRS